MTFDQWWEENKKNICSDITRTLGLDLSNPVVEERLKHIASQAWVARTYEND